MCEFCENEKNLSVTEGIVKIEKSRYSPSGYLLIADNSGEEYGKANCSIRFCPMCGRKLSEVSEMKTEFEDGKTAEVNFPLDPIDVASMIINARVEYETNALQRVLGAREKVLVDKYSDDDLRQIADHLLVYCNHNSEKTEQ